MKQFLIICFFIVLSYGKNIEIKDAFVRMMPPNAKATAAFMVINNNSDKTLKLIRVTSDIAKITEMHNVSMIKSDHDQKMMMKMHPVPFIEIRAKASVVLKKGHLHLMMMQLKKPLKLNSFVSFEFYFDDGSSFNQKIQILRR